MPPNEWQNTVIRRHNAFFVDDSGHPKKPLRVWCPILKQYLDWSRATAMHIIPSKADQVDVYWQLGHYDDEFTAKDILRRIDNGLVTSLALKDRFCNGDRVIVPMETEPGKPQRLQFVLLNKAWANQRVGDTKKRFSDIDGKDLVFKGSRRPGLQFLYWHYVVSILRTKKRRDDAWTEPVSYMRYLCCQLLKGIRWVSKREETPSTAGPDDDWLSTFQKWTERGSYIRRSVIKPLGKALADCQLKDENFSEGAWDGRARSAELDPFIEEIIASKLEQSFSEGRRSDVSDSLLRGSKNRSVY